MRSSRFVSLSGWVLGALLVVLGCTQSTGPSTVWITQAERALLDGKFDTALQICDQKLAGDRTTWQAHVLRGRVFMLRGEFQDALNEFSAAQEFKPNEVDTRYRLADALKALGRMEESMAEQQRARQEDTTREAAYAVSPSSFDRPPPIVATSRSESEAPDDESRHRSESSSNERQVVTDQAKDAEDSQESHDRGMSTTETRPSDEVPGASKPNLSFADQRRDEMRDKSEDRDSSALNGRTTRDKKRTSKRDSRLSQSETEENNPSGQDAEDRDDPETDEKKGEDDQERPKPVISTALPSLEFGKYPPISSSGSYSNPSSSPSLTRQGSSPITTGIHSQGSEFGVPSGGSSNGYGLGKNSDPYGSSRTSSYSGGGSDQPSVYSRINPIYAPRAIQKGGVGPLYSPSGSGLGSPGYGGSNSSKRPPKATLSTSLPGTAPVTGNTTTTGAVPLSTSLPGRSGISGPSTGSSNRVGSALKPGVTPYKGIPGNSNGTTNSGPVP